MHERQQNRLTERPFELIAEIGSTNESASFWEQISGQSKQKINLSTNLVILNRCLQKINVAAQVSSDRRLFAEYINGIENLSDELIRLRNETIDLARNKKTSMALDDDEDAPLIALANEFISFQHLITLNAEQLKSVAMEIEETLSIIADFLQGGLTENEKKRFLNKKAELLALQNEVIAAMKKYLLLLDQEENFAEEGMLHYFITQINHHLAPFRPDSVGKKMYGNYDDFLKDIPIRLINGCLENPPKDAFTTDNPDEEFEEFIYVPGNLLEKFFRSHIEKNLPASEHTHFHSTEKEKSDVEQSEKEELASFGNFYQQLVRHKAVLALFDDEETVKNNIQEICSLIDDKCSFTLCFTDEEKEFLKKGDDAKASLLSPEKPSRKEKEKKEEAIKEKHGGDGNKLYSELKKLEEEHIQSIQGEISKFGDELTTYKLAASYKIAKERNQTFIAEMDTFFELVDKAHPTLKNEIQRIRSQWENRRLFANLSSGAIQKTNESIEAELKKLESFIVFVKAQKKPLDEKEKQLLVGLKNLIHRQREKICAVMLERVMLCRDASCRHDDVVYDTLQGLKALGLNNEYPRYFRNEKMEFQPIIAFSMTDEQRFAFIKHIRQYGSKEQKQTLYDFYEGRVPDKQGWTTLVSDLNDSFFLTNVPEAAKESMMLSTGSIFISIDVTPDIASTMSLPLEMSQSFVILPSSTKESVTKEQYDKAMDSLILNYRNQVHEYAHYPILDELFANFIKSTSYDDYSSNVGDDGLDSFCKEQQNLATLHVSLIREACCNFKESLGLKNETAEIDQYFYNKTLSYSKENLPPVALKKAIRDTTVWWLTKDWVSNLDKSEFASFIRDSITIDPSTKEDTIVPSIKKKITLFMLKQDLVAWMVDELTRIRTQNRCSLFFMSSNKTQDKIHILKTELNKLIDIDDPEQLSDFINKLTANHDLFQTRNYLPFASSDSKIQSHWLEFTTKHQSLIDKVQEDAKNEASPQPRNT